MTISPVVRNAAGQIDELLVATWPDGSELWRVLLAFPDLDRQQYRFRTAAEAAEKDRTVQQILETMGLGFGFGLDMAGRVITSAPEEKAIWDRGVRYLRWFLGRTKIVRMGDSPLHPRNPVDPAVGYFRDLSASLEEARQIDDISYRIRKRLNEDGGAPREPSWTRASFYEAANEMGFGWSDLSERVRAFFDDLLDGRHLRVQPQGVDAEVRRTGYFKAEVRRHRIDEHAAALPDAWATVGDLAYQMPPTMTRLIVWLQSQPNHPGFVVCSSRRFFDEWMEDNTVVGTFSMSAEEAEVYELLGEKLPYLWEPRALQAWAEDRWGGSL